jgi:hypothetical protein
MQTNLERFLIGWLQARTTALVTDETPAEDDWPEDYRVVRIVDVGGTDLGRTLAVPAAAVDFFAGNRRDVIQLSLDIHDLFRYQLQGAATAEGQRVNQVSTLTRPAWGPTESPTLKYRFASYQLVLH